MAPPPVPNARRATEGGGTAIGPFNRATMRTGVTKICIGVVALLVVMVAIFRPGWGRSRPAGVVDPASYPLEYRAGLMEYDLDPKSRGTEAVVTKVGDLIEAQSDSLALPAPVRAALREAATRRIELLIAPDFEKWRQDVLANPCEAPAGLDDQSPERDSLLKKWRQSAAVLTQSPIASAGVQVHTFEPTEGPRLGVPGTSFLRSGGPGGAAARYPEPPTDVHGVQCVEILVPMLYRPPDGKEPLPVNVAFRFYRRPADTAWSPADLYLYFDQSSFGRGLIGPIY